MNTNIPNMKGSRKKILVLTCLLGIPIERRLLLWGLVNVGVFNKTSLSNPSVWWDSIKEGSDIAMVVLECAIVTEWDKVYTMKPATVNELRATIGCKCIQIPGDLFLDVCYSIVSGPERTSVWEQRQSALMNHRLGLLVHWYVNAPWEWWCSIGYHGWEGGHKQTCLSNEWELQRAAKMIIILDYLGCGRWGPKLRIKTCPQNCCLFVTVWLDTPRPWQPDVKVPLKVTIAKDVKLFSAFDPSSKGIIGWFHPPSPALDTECQVQRQLNP